MHSEYVYVLKSGPYFKIGRTNDLGRRIGQLKIQLPFEVELFKVINTDDSAKLEKYFHKIYAAARVNGEWFQLDMHTIADLFLVPSTIEVNGNSSNYQAEMEPLLDEIAKKMERRAEDKALERFIAEEADFEASSVPENWGGAPLADYIAYECPYDLPESIEWLVADDDSEE